MRFLWALVSKITLCFCRNTCISVNKKELIFVAHKKSWKYLSLSDFIHLDSPSSRLKFASRFLSQRFCKRVGRISTLFTSQIALWYERKFARFVWIKVSSISKQKQKSLFCGSLGDFGSKFSSRPPP